MKNAKFEAEFELSFELPFSYLLGLVENKTLQILDTYDIVQKWCIKGTSEGVPYSSRIRCTQRVMDKDDPPVYEHALKYYLDKTERIELNSPITAEEYHLIDMLHPHGKEVHKTRLLFIEKEPHADVKYYMVDVFSGDEHRSVIVEIEFESEEQQQAFKAPDWLAPYAKENK